MVLLAVFLVIALVGIGFHFLDAGEVFVRVERVGFQLDHGDGDVRAVVGHALVVGQQVVEEEAVEQRTVALLEAVDMVELQLVAEIVDQLLQRLYAGRQGRSLRMKALTVIWTISASADSSTASSRTASSEKTMLFSRISFAVSRNIERVVRNALEIGDRVQEFRGVLVLFRAKLLPGQLDKVAAEAVFVAVDDLLHLDDGAVALVRNNGAGGASPRRGFPAPQRPWS